MLIKKLENIARLMNEVLVNPNATLALFLAMGDVSDYADRLAPDSALRAWLEACLHYAGTA